MGCYVSKAALLYGASGFVRGPRLLAASGVYRFATWNALAGNRRSDLGGVSMKRRACSTALSAALVVWAQTAAALEPTAPALKPAGNAAPEDRAQSGASARGALAAGEPGLAPSVLVHTQGTGFPAPFERIFDFGQLPLAGEYRDVTQSGIRLRADGLRHWVHLDGSPLGGRVARQPDAAERWTIDLPPGSHALEFRLWESTTPGVGASTCYNFEVCFDTLYRVRVFGEADVLLRDFDYSPPNDRLNTVALWSPTPIARVVLTGEINNIDDEFLGTLRVGSRPLPAGLRYAPSRLHSGFGLHAALAASRAVIADAEGFEAWRKTSANGWSYSGRLDIEGSIERVAMDEGHVAIAVSTPAGPRLRIHAIQGEDPSSWPLSEIAHSGSVRDLEVDGDIIALGIDGSVRIHWRAPGAGWRFEHAMVPDPPIPGADEFGRDLGLDGGHLVVNAGRGYFHVYARGPEASFSEVFRQEQSVFGPGRLDISGTTVAHQSTGDSLSLFSADASGVWGFTSSRSGALPAEFGLGRGTAVRIEGATVIALMDFQTPASPEFRQVVSLWSHDGVGGLSRSALFVDPHLPGSGSARLGNAGRAFALHGDDILLGQPFTDWCDHADRGFIGDSGPQGYADVCAGRSGAVIFASARGLTTLFASGFEH